MSFNFEWPTFSDTFYNDARQILEQALNKGAKPPIIADKIQVKELDMGTIPPELEILEIGDLTTERFRGIFRLTYSGDAFITLQTKVQANPLSVPTPSVDILNAPRMLFAAAPLAVPMTLRLSDLSLRAIIVLVISRQKGITLVFKNDPLESVNVSSSFDGVESIAGFIQREIENQLREAFRNDLPSVIHRLSQKWISGEVKNISSGPGMPGNKGPRGFAKDATIETMAAFPSSGPKGLRERGSGHRRRMESLSISGDTVSIAETSTTLCTPSFTPTTFLPSPQTSKTEFENSSVPDSIESYDPTYGLRPDSIPIHAGFGNYERLLRSQFADRGFGGVLEDTEVEEPSYDAISLDDLIEDGITPGISPYQWDHASGSSVGGFESIPAVGGGTITRPRIFHAQSQMQTHDSSSSSISAHASPSIASTNRTPSVTGYAPGAPIGLAPLSTLNRKPLLVRNDSMLSATSQRGISPLTRSNLVAGTSTRSSSLSPHSMAKASPSGSPPPYSPPHISEPIPIRTKTPEPEFVSFQGRPDPIDWLSRSPTSLLDSAPLGDSQIVINPRNERCAQLGTLTMLNQTLSPFTRTHEHVTVRSAPFVISRNNVGGGSVNRTDGEGSVTGGKAIRKRTHRIGAAKRKMEMQQTPHGTYPRTPSMAPSEISDYFPSTADSPPISYRR